MKSRILLGFLILLSVERLNAQGYGAPLTMQGLERFTIHSAAQRAMGGVSMGIQNDLGAMFHNPATLESLEGPAIAVGGLGQSSNSNQVQHYAPVKYYSNLSLLLEGLTGSIPDPDTLLGGATAADTVQRPFDSSGPNWSSSKSRVRPLDIFLGMPFEVEGMRVVVAAGAVEYADLNYLYQNNNVLSPSILSERPLPTPRPTNDANPILVEWSQRINSREGSVRGYGVALSGSLPEHNLTAGVSAMLLSGSSDDLERTVSRGRLTFFTNSFRLDSVSRVVTRTAKSNYRGQEFTVSILYRTRAVNLGVSVKLPTTIERTYSANVETQGSSSGTVTNNGKDHLTLPWRGTAGISITPREGFLLAVEYESRPYGSAEYKTAQGGLTQPWLSASLLRIGVQYDAFPWLVVRGGIRGQAEVFEPEGNPLGGEPVSYSVYSFGVGATKLGFRLDLTYEFMQMKYQDVWGSALSLNRTRNQAIIASVSYDLSAIW